MQTTMAQLDPTGEFVVQWLMPQPRKSVDRHTTCV